LGTGVIEWEARDREAARQALYEAVANAEASSHDRAAAEGWASLVEVLTQISSLEEAERAAHRAKAALDRLGDDGLARAAYLIRVGSLHRHQGKYAVAEWEFREAIRIQEGSLEAADRDVVDALDGLAGALFFEGRKDEGLAVEKRALAIAERLFGPSHPSVALALENLGACYWQHGDYGEALIAYRRSVAIAESSLPPHDYALAMGGLGGRLCERGDVAEGLPLLEKAVSIMEGADGLDHPEDAFTMHRLARCYRDTHRREDEIAMHLMALALREQRLGMTHPMVANSLDYLGQALLAQKQPAQAIDQFERALHILEEARSDNGPDAAVAMLGIGEGRLAMGDPTGAIAPLERALALCAETMGAGKDSEARFALARATWDTHRDRAHAVELATLARDGFTAIGRAGEADRSRVDTWLSARIPARRN
jgi:tetratricopeptide (TPR) repeat protein